MKRLKVRVRRAGSVTPAQFNILKISHDEKRREEFSHARLHAIFVTESVLADCLFDDLQAQSVSFGGGQKQSRFTDCRFTNCDLVFSAPGDARLERCVFDRCRLENVMGTRLELVECSFPGTTIEGGVFHAETIYPRNIHGARQKNEFRDNDFSQARLLDVDFRGGIDLRLQKLPSTEDYLFISNTCEAARVGRALLPSLDEKSKAKCEDVIRSLERHCADSQETQLLHIPRAKVFGQMLRQHLRLT